MFSDPVFSYIAGIVLLIVGYFSLYLSLGVLVYTWEYLLLGIGWVWYALTSAGMFLIEHTTGYRWIKKLTLTDKYGNITVTYPGVWEHTSRTQEVLHMQATIDELNKQLKDLRDKRTVWRSNQLSFENMATRELNGHKPTMFLRNIRGKDYLLVFKNQDFKYFYSHPETYAWVERLTYTRDKDNKSRRSVKYRWVKRVTSLDDTGDEFFNKKTDDELLKTFPPTWKNNGRLEYIPDECLPFTYEEMETQEPLKEWESVQQQLL